MGRISRRSAVSGALAGAFVCLAAPTSPLMAAQPVRIPRGPMRLTRRLERGMRGGAMLIVEREWRVRFTAQGRGFAITGEQVSAKVDAPTGLAPLAKIERSRSTADMFPILLETNGSISAAGPGTRAKDLQEAIREAETIIAKRAIPSDAKALQMRYLAQLQRAGSSFLRQLPRDLFFPVSQPSRSVRPVNLPEGLVGEFEVTYEARRAASHQWLDYAERRVITRIGESKRHSREVWSMALF